jgi:hypothetical protein
MQTMHSLSREGQDPTSSRPPLDWTDRALIRRLLVDARVAFEDADAVTCDLLRKKRRRGLGHVQHKRLYRDARAKLVEILGALLAEPAGGAP